MLYLNLLWNVLWLLYIMLGFLFCLWFIYKCVRLLSYIYLQIIIKTDGRLAFIYFVVEDIIYFC